MSDEAVSAPGSIESGRDDGPDTVPQAAWGPSTAGGLLRAARQAQGMDLASLAAMLKVPLRRLESLEQGRHDELQGPTFERALAQAACRILKIDAVPVLALLPRHERNTLERVTEGLNTPFRERQGGASFGGDMPSRLRPVVVVPVLIVIAALALFYVPTGLWSRVQPIVASIASFASSPSSSAAPATPVAVATADKAASAATSTTTSTVLLPVANADATGGAAPAIAASASVGAPANAAAAVPAASGVDEVLAHSEAAPPIPVQIVAGARNSWVEVVDAHGHSLLSRTVLAGESVSLDGAMPMRVKIGNAEHTRLTLRGDNVDLTPWTRDNIAHVELK